MVRVRLPAGSRWLAPLLLCGALMLPGRAAAQARDFAALQDSLAALDRADVRRLQGRIAALDAAVAGPVAARAVALMERGFLQLRLSEIQLDEDLAVEATQSFRAALDLAPETPWAHYGLALAYLAGPGVRINVLGGVLSGLTIAQVAAEVVGEDPRSRAVRALRRALELDPALEPAAVELARQALQTRERRELQQALAALQVTQARRPTATGTLWLADVAVALGDLQQAEAAADALATLVPDTSVLLHTRASILFRLPGQQARALESYDAGLERLTRAGELRYYNDLEMLVSEQERLQWLNARDVADVGPRRDWVRTFWGIRAAKSAITVEERIAEHYRRVDVARTRYRRSRRLGAPDVNSVLLQLERDRLPFDDRGVVYLRYGAPDDVIRTTARGLHPNETWVYHAIEGERQFFHFVAVRGGVDFTLVDNLFAAMDQPTPDEAIIELLEDRAALDPRYPIFAARLRALQNLAARDRAMPELAGTGASDYLTSIELENRILSGEHRREVLENMRRDAAVARFAEPLDYYYDLFGLRAADQRTEITAAFAVPGSAVTGREVDGRLIYAFDVSLILIDTLHSRVERQDTTLRFWSARPLRADENIRFHLKLTTAPSTTFTHRVVVRSLDETRAGNVYGGGLEVLDYGVPRLQVSDLVLADSTFSGTWQHDGVQLSLLPPRRLIEDRPFSLFYEIYNLPAGDPYRTELVVERTGGRGAWGSVKRLFGGDAAAVRLNFEGVSAANVSGTQQELRRVRTSLDPGRYRLQVTTTNLRTGERATRDKLFLVIRAPREKD